MRKIATVLAGGASYLSLAGVANAANLNICPQGSQFGALCNFNTGSFGGIVGALITLAFVIAVVIALGFLIYGGIRWIVSGGDKAGVEGARNIIVAALVGLVIVFLAYFILNIVIGFFLPGFNIRNIQLPHFQP